MQVLSPRQWGARVDYDAWRDPYTPDDKIIVHHGGGPNPAGDLDPDPNRQRTREVATLRGWESWHVDGRKWRGLAYGWAIGQSGTVYRVRGWNSYGAHSGDLDGDRILENEEGIPVVFILGAGQDPTPAALASFDRLRSEVIEADPRIGRRLPVYGHREVAAYGWGAATSCPGNVFAYIDPSDRLADLSPTKEPDLVASLPTLREGDGFTSTGRAHLRYHVRILQASLAVAGVIAANTFDAQHRPDGLYGSGTRGAVRTFQSRAGLPVDGIAGPDTWRKLLLP